MTDYDTWTQTRNARFEAANYSSRPVHTKVPTTYAPTKTIDTDQLDASVAEQVQCFGHAEYANQIGSSSTSYKYAKKQQALGRSLNAAFRPRDARPSETLSLATQHDSDWTPVTADPVDELIAAEDAKTLSTRIEDTLSGLDERQRLAIVIAANGGTHKDVAERLSVSPANARKILQRARVAVRN